jgi:hypothetical protein
MTLFVRTLDKKWIAFDRIIVISNREKYRDSESHYFTVRYELAGVEHTARVDEGELVEVRRKPKLEVVPGDAA